MRIKAKLTIFQLFIITLSGIFITAAYFAISSQNNLFRRFIRDQNTITVNSILDLQRQSIIKTVVDYTVWDSMFSYVKTRSLPWAKNNIDTILTDFEYDHIWILDSKSNVIYYIHGEDSNDIRNIPFMEPEMKRLIAERPMSYFFMIFENQLLEIAVSKISPTGDASRYRSNGYMAVARVWNELYIDSLRSQTLHEIFISPVVNNEGGENPQKKNRITVTRDLPDIFGNNFLTVYFSRQVKEMDSLVVLSYCIYALIIITSLAVFLLFFVFIGRWISRPLNLISATLDTENIRILNEVEKNHDEFYQIAELIKSSLANKHKLEELLEISRIDLSMAVSVQKSFLPQSAPLNNDWDTAFFLQPMTDVSGDFYDFYVLGDKYCGLGIYDVSGHGIASGLVTMIAKSLFFRSFRDYGDSGIDKVFGSVSSELYAAIGSSNYYLSGIILRFSTAGVEYCNAMHPPLLKKHGNTTERICNDQGEDLNGFFIGFDDADYRYDQVLVNVTHGEYLLLYTDCLLEALSAEGERYGIERIEKSFAKAPCGSAQDVTDYILDDFFNFTVDRHNLPDDLTVIVLKRK